MASVLSVEGWQQTGDKVEWILHQMCQTCLKQEAKAKDGVFNSKFSVENCYDK